MVANIPAHRPASGVGRLCDRVGSRLPERAAKLGEDRQVGVKPDSLKAAYAQREQRPFVLEPSELALDGSTAAVQVARPLRVARDQGVQPVGLDPHARGLALARGAAPLRCLRL